jgi:Fuc2NAc and GlcNAc transferase
MDGLYNAQGTIALFALPVLVCLATVVGVAYYRNLAIRRGIIARINFRTLHEKIVPRGGGIVFATVFAAAIIASWLAGRLPGRLMLAFGLGGGVAGVIGFIDDIHEVRPLHKLTAQFCLALWFFALIYEPLYAPIVRGHLGVTKGIIVLLLLFISVWLINLYNFIDGIDGLAISGSVFICCAVMIVLAISGGDQRLLFVIALLAASSVGFLFFNLPPASIFMGDAGSIFLGYCFGATLLMTVFSRQISGWTWLTILGYFIADTTTTSLARIVLVKKNWYGVHRSHAYQNLARIYKSHAKVTYGVIIYNLLWVLPLAVWSVMMPEWAPAAAVLSLSPGVIWTLRFGPTLSSD